MKNTILILMVWVCLYSCQKDDYTNTDLSIQEPTTKKAKSSNSIANKLFEDSYHAIKLMRNSNGVYLDALALNNAYNKPGSIAANGVGLISLCIADSMYKKTNDAVNWENTSENLVTSTLNTFLSFKNNGATNTNGLFRRYFNVNTGFKDGSWSEEYSTIDNAIFAMGLIFCKNYYSNNTSIVNKVNLLLSNMDFTAAISSDGQQLYMVLDEFGNGSATTGAYNEYMIVAWLAKNVNSSNAGYLKSQTYWNSHYDSPSSTFIHPENYWGIDLISDGSFVSNFIPLFTYYYCNYFKNNSEYMTYFDNFRKSDSLFWTKIAPGINSYEWGLGAGENPGGGYSANAIDRNNQQIVSPHIIAGFIPIYSQSKNDLLSLYDKGNGTSVYSLPGSPSRKVLWRYSRLNTSLRCSYIQAVDFSTMLYGLATLPDNLGTQFFTTNCNLNSSILGQ